MSPLAAGLLGYVLGAVTVWIIDAIDHKPNKSVANDRAKP